jgi:hypothetical protein
MRTTNAASAQALGGRPQAAYADIRLANGHAMQSSAGDRHKKSRRALELSCDHIDVSESVYPIPYLMNSISW